MIPLNLTIIILICVRMASYSAVPILTAALAPDYVLSGYREAGEGSLVVAPARLTSLVVVAFLSRLNALPVEIGLGGIIFVGQGLMTGVGG